LGTISLIPPSGNGLAPCGNRGLLAFEPTSLEKGVCHMIKFQFALLVVVALTLWAYLIYLCI